jgi:hypothetical protein
MIMKTKQLTTVKLTQVLKLFDDQVADEIGRHITDSELSFGSCVQDTLVKRDIFLELIADVFEGSDASEEDYRTLKGSLNGSISNVKTKVHKNTYIIIED